MKVKSSNLVFVIIWTCLNILDVAKAAANSQRSSPSRDSRSSSKKPQLGTSSSATLKLEHISVLFTHGVTGPKHFLTTMSGLSRSYWKQITIGGHDLTATGLDQMTRFGRALNIKYKGPLGVRTYQTKSVNKGLPIISGIDVSEIGISSSGTEISRQSVKAVRDGLTQEQFFMTPQPKVGVFADDWNLAKWPIIEPKVMKNKDKKLEQLGKNYESLIEHFNAKVPPCGDFKPGAKIRTIQQLWTVVDNVLRERATGQTSQSPAILNNLVRYTKFYFEFLEIEYGLDVKIINELIIGLLLDTMVEKINEFVSSSSSSLSVKSSSSSVTSSSSSVIPKIQLYSSYDVTIIAFLKALGVNPSNEIYQRYGLYPVLPGSSVILELYSQRSSKGKEYFVQVLFNKDSESINAVPLLLDGCMDVVCPLKIFLSKVSGLALTGKSFQQKVNEL